MAQASVLLGSRHSSVTMPASRRDRGRAVVRKCCPSQLEELRQQLGALPWKDRQARILERVDSIWHRMTTSEQDAALRSGQVPASLWVQREPAATPAPGCSTAGSSPGVCNSAAPEAGTAFDGVWTHMKDGNGEAGIIEGTLLQWHDGGTVRHLVFPSPTELQLVVEEDDPDFEPGVYPATLCSDGNLRWETGEVWVRICEASDTRAWLV